MKVSRFIALAAAADLTAGVMSGCSKKDDSSASGEDSGAQNKPGQTAYYSGEHKDTGWEWGNVEIVGGGFVPNIVYNPTEEGLVYARTDIGGAYKLDKETNRWKCITDFVGGEDWNLRGIESIATDPVEPTPADDPVELTPVDDPVEPTPVEDPEDPAPVDDPVNPNGYDPLG